MMQGKSIIEPLIQQGNKQLNEKRLHPCQKPILLWDLILLFCLENKICIEKCFDSNMGTGSFVMSGLKFDQIKEITACDINKDYYTDAMKRINAHMSQTKLF